VWNYFYKLQKIDSAQSIDVFKRKPVSDQFQPMQVAEKLHSIPDLCIDYLEHIVYEKEVADTEIHTYLGTRYIDRILASKSSSNSVSTGVQSTRDKLLRLVVESNNLKCQYLIGKLQNSTMRLELAILHGKVGDHTQALVVMVRELGDHKLAREYCRKLGKSMDRKRAYVELLRLYIDVPQENQDTNNLVSVLSDFVQDFDLVIVLSLLPDEIPLSVIAGVVQRATRKVVHNNRRSKLMKALAKRTLLDTKVDEYENNCGFAVEEESICDVCSKQLDGIETITFSDGFVGHDKCLI